jgi:hypothetical protein
VEEFNSGVQGVQEFKEFKEFKEFRSSGVQEFTMEWIAELQEEASAAFGGTPAGRCREPSSELLNSCNT